MNRIDYPADLREELDLNQPENEVVEAALEELEPEIELFNGYKYEEIVKHEEKYKIDDQIYYEKRDVMI